MGYIINSFRFAPIIISNEGTFYASSTDGTNRLMKSDDGINWVSVRTGDNSGQWWAITWARDKNIIVAVDDDRGTTSKIMYSTNGTTWNTSTIDASDVRFRNIGYSPSLGKFSAIANAGTNRVYYSTNGINFTAGSISSRNWNSIVWAEEFALFIVGGRLGGANTQAIIGTSSDGETYTDRYTSAGNDNSVALGYSPTLGTSGRAVALMGRTSNTGRYSDDGTDWTNTVTHASASWNSIDWSPTLNIFVAVSSATNFAASSTDGITWTTRTAAENNAWVSVVWSDYLQMFVAVSTTGTNRVMYSTNGTSWTSASAAEANIWRNITYTDGFRPFKQGTFIAISQNGTNRLMTSLNGINWTLRTLPTATYINIAYSDDLDLFVVEDNGGEIITSSDGTTWTSRTKPADISSAKHNCVKWAKSIGEFISVKDSGTDRLARSSDGINWTSDSFISATFEGLCYSDDLGMLVAYGLTGATGSAAIIYTSTDGTNWTSRTPFRTDSTSVIRKMIWIPELGRFVAGDGAGRFQTSTDGITWTDYGSVSNMGNVYSLAYSADLDVIVALASSGTARAASRAGTAGAWTSRTIGTQTWFQVEYDEYTQVFSAVATDGRATYSTNGTTWATATTPQANTWFGMVIVNGKIII